MDIVGTVSLHQLRRLFETVGFLPAIRISNKLRTRKTHLKKLPRLAGWYNVYKSATEQIKIWKYDKAITQNTASTLIFSTSHKHLISLALNRVRNERAQ